MKSLRPFQQEARIQTNQNLNRSLNTAMIMPCGCGKTFTSAKIIEDRNRQNRRVYVLVPQREIFNQWMDELHEAGLNPGYINREGMKGRDRGVYVCMAQSLSNLLLNIPESLWPNEIFLDECQHTLAPFYFDTYDYFNRNSAHHIGLVGLTATLHHGSGGSFRPYFDDLIQTIRKPEAIDAGYIARPVPVVPSEFLADIDIPVVGDDYDMEAQAALLGDPVIVGDIIETYELIFQGKPVIVPCATYKHADYMTQMFRKAGWKADHIHSKLPDHIRDRMLKDVAAQKTNALCTVGIGIEGLSINGLSGVLWCKRTLSPITWTQFNGRAERLFPGKEHAFIVDFVGNTFIHGLPDRERTWTLDGSDPAEKEPVPVMQKCPFCGTLQAKDNLECWYCRRPLVGDEAEKARSGKGRKIPVMVDGEMIALTRDGMEKVKANIQKVKGGIEEQETEKKKAEEAPVSLAEKNQIIRKNLFKGRRNGMFGDAVRGMV